MLTSETCRASAARWFARTSTSTATGWRAKQSPSTCTIRPAASCSRSVASASAAQVEQAVAVAAAVRFRSGRSVLARERASILRRWYELIVENADELAADRHGRAGQAARRGPRRGPLRRRLRRVVRRGGQACLRGRDPDQPAGPAHGRHQAADRRLRRDHSVELPVGDDPAQGRPGARGRLHDGAQARRARRLSRRSRWPSWPSVPGSRPVCSTSCTGRRRRSARCSPRTRRCGR